LKEKAAAMHKPTVELAGTLLQAIVDSDLYDAVLDQREDDSKTNSASDVGKMVPVKKTA